MSRHPHPQLPLTHIRSSGGAADPSLATFVDGTNNHENTWAKTRFSSAVLVAPKRYRSRSLHAPPSRSDKPLINENSEFAIHLRLNLTYFRHRRRESILLWPSHRRPRILPGYLPIFREPRRVKVLGSVVDTRGRLADSLIESFFGLSEAANHRVPPWTSWVVEMQLA